MKRILLTLTLLTLSGIGFADEASPVVTPEHYIFRTDYFSINMPSGQQNLGLVGFHTLKSFDNGIYAGLGLYSTVAGNYSGFFALGGELGWQHLLYKQIGLDTGVFAGSGGGESLSNQIGNGSFVLPHVGLYYDFSWIKAGLDYSTIRFNTDQVNSHQWIFHLDWPFTLPTTNYTVLPDQPITYDISKNYIGAVGSIYHPVHSQFIDGAPLTANTELLGIEFGHFLTPHWYNYFQFDGAAHGNHNGYANIFAGFGWQHFLGESPFLITTRLALGSGGGGDYDTGSGLLVYPTVGLGWQFASHWQAEVLSGYLSSVNAHYHAVTGEFVLKHDFDIATPGERYAGSLLAFDPQQWRVRVGNQTYMNAAREDETSSNINLIAVKIDRLMSPHWYLTGQSAFAYTGHAAGYFSGLLGAGYQTSDWHKLNLFTEALLGTAGGAQFDIHDGALGQAGIGVNYQYRPDLGFYSELSRTQAFKGSFHPTTIDAGLSYSFGFLEHPSHT